METHITLLILCKNCKKSLHFNLRCELYFFIHFCCYGYFFYCTGCIEKYAVNIIRIIIRKLIHSSFSVLNSVLLACRENFAEVSDTAEKVEVCVRLFTAESRTTRHDEAESPFANFPRKYKMTVLY